MKPSITRWKIVPLYSESVRFSPVPGSVHSFAPVARPTKLSTVSGALSARRRIRILPSDVTSVANLGTNCLLYRLCESVLALWNDPVRLTRMADPEPRNHLYHRPPESTRDDLDAKNT